MNTTESVDKNRLLFAAKKVYTCVSRNRAAYVWNLTLESALNDDLGLYGDDVDDLVKDLMRFFTIDWSHFEFSQYFPSEGFNPFPLIFFAILFPFWLIFKIVSKFAFRQQMLALAAFIAPPTRVYRPFQLRALVWAAYQQKWDDAVPDLNFIRPELSKWQSQFERRYNQKKKKTGGYFR